MKTLLELGLPNYIAPNATVAAKISDLLAKCVPVEAVYRSAHPEDESAYIYTKPSNFYANQVSITSAEGIKVFPNRTCPEFLAAYNYGMDKETALDTAATPKPEAEA